MKKPTLFASCSVHAVDKLTLTAAAPNIGGMSCPPFEASASIAPAMFGRQPSFFSGERQSGKHGGQ